MKLLRGNWNYKQTLDLYLSKKWIIMDNACKPPLNNAEALEF